MPNDESSTSPEEQRLLEGFQAVLDDHAADELEAAAAQVLTRFLILSIAPDDPPPELAVATYKVVLDDLLLVLSMLNQRDPPFMARALATATQVLFADMAALRALRAERPDVSPRVLVDLLARQRESRP